MSGDYRINSLIRVRRNGGHAMLVCAAAMWIVAPPQLRAQPATPEQIFADYFASVFRENPDGASGWGSPGEYLDAAKGSPPSSPASSDAILRLPINQYQLLVIPGFLSDCATAVGAPVFQQAQQHLKMDHGVEIATLPMPIEDASSETNGALIATFLKHQPKDGKKFIVVGHSKGAVDLQLALEDMDARSRVAAFISVAGAIRGSPLAAGSDILSAIKPLQTKLGCAGALGPALDSLQPDKRNKYVESHPQAPVPSYSVVAVSEFLDTSQLLKGPWLSVFAQNGFGPEDGLLTASQGTLPGAKFLGTLLADHVAVAHDFRGTLLEGEFDAKPFPRAALLEALVRFVVADLQSPLSAGTPSH